MIMLSSWDSIEKSTICYLHEIAFKNDNQIYNLHEIALKNLPICNLHEVVFKSVSWFSSLREWGISQSTPKFGFQ